MRGMARAERRRRSGAAGSAVVRACTLIIAVIAAFLVPIDARADEGPSAEGRTLTVQPGDTLYGIAERYGVSVTALMQVNAIRHPRNLYPGQTLALPGSVPVPETVRTLTLAWGEDFDLLARRAGLSPAELARANRILHPRRLPLGMHLVGPIGLPARTIAPSLDAAPRIGSAMMAGVDLWAVLRLNPDPIPRGGRLLVPDTAGEDGGGTTGGVMPEALIVDVSVFPQPVQRGRTAMIRLTTTEPVSCTLQYLDRTEACYSSGASVAGTPSVTYAFAGLPALLPPGEHTAVLALSGASGGGELPVALRVSPGRFDYERIDLPPDRQSLLDPARAQAERETIAALRTVRSSERRWSLPFLAPLQGSITSYYGSRRSYGHGFSSYHAGADFQAATGAPVVAPASGRVVLAEPLVIRGNAVMIDHGWGVVTGYWHLSTLEVSVGQEVAAGTRIGAVGNTGLSTGSHLHWELWVNGIAVDPLPWLEAAPGTFEALMTAGPGGAP